jgi:hypothetical protein
MPSTSSLPATNRPISESSTPAQRIASPSRLYRQESSRERAGVTRGHTVLQGFTLGSVQIAVSMTVNALIILAAGSIAGFIRSRPTWATWQRRITGTMLGAVAVLLAREVPERARI